MPIFTGGGGSNLWSVPANWDTGVLPSATGAGTDAIFNASSPNCTVDTASAVCRNLNFTGYTGTITMTNAIVVGSSTAGNPSHAVTLSAGMSVSPSGTGAITTRAHGTTTLTSNGFVWPNQLRINTATVATVTSSVAVLADNWSVGSLSLGPSANNLITFNGAFTITVNGNFAINQIGGTSSYVSTTAGSIPTIKLAGTGTWSVAATFVAAASAALGFGPNINIDAPGQTVTISDNCYYGGAGVVANQSTFSYTAGTVVHNGTFRMLGIQAGNTYNLNLSGSSSTSATNTNASGVNFNNLQLRTTATSASQIANITGNICVVNTLSINAVTAGAPKGPMQTTGGRIYLNGNLTINGGTRSPSTTILTIQGISSTWTENAVTTNFLSYGVAWQVEINTTGTVTVGSDIGIKDSGSLTYVSGSFITTGYNIYADRCSFYGWGGSGIILNGLVHVSQGTIAVTGSRLYFYGTPATRFVNMSFANFATTNGFGYEGTGTWSCDNLNFQQPLSSSSTGFLIQANGQEYKVNNSFIFNNNGAVLGQGMGRIGSGQAIFTLAYGASQDVYFHGATFINSSAGQTVWSRSGTITNTLNWQNWDYPKTRHSTSIS